MATTATAHRELAELWNRRDFAGLRRLFHDQYTYTGADGKELPGPEAGIAMAQFFANAFPDGTLEVRRVHVSGDTAIAEMIGRGTHDGDLMGIPPTGKKVQVTICNVFELRDGRVYREREYLDMLTILTQIGAVKPPGGA